ncbi:MAG: hypothetical protein ACK5LY_02845 [Lachnospirales bacterium]
MNLNFSFKKIISFVLIMILSTTALPSTTVYADKQKAISNLGITFDSSKSENNYNYILSWNKATDSGISDGPNITNVLENGKTKFYYQVTFRPEGTTNAEVLDTISDVQEKYTYNISKQLDKGKFYYHKVITTHQHMNTETGDVTDASQETAIADQQESIFMSDLDFDVTVNGRELTFEWSNPKKGNYVPFSTYSVFYSVSDKSTGTTINATSGNRIDIKTQDATLSDGKLIYKYTMPDLIVGKFYSFKIEPVYNGSTLRGVVTGETPQSSIKISDKDYNIAYSKNEFRVDGIYVSPNLYIETLNAEFIKLYWDAFDPTTMSTSDFKLELYSDTALDGENLTGSKKLVAIIENFNVVSWIEEAPQTVMYYQFVATSGDTVMTSNIAVYDQSYDKFAPYSPIIRDVVAGKSDLPYFNMTWDSFVRNPLGTEESNLTAPFEGMFEDKNIYYKVWVTDSMSNFNNSNILDYFYNNSQSDTPLDAVKLSSSVEEYLDAQGNSKDVLVYDSEDISAFKNINQYVTYENGYPEMVALEENKVYYIKIQAFRKGVTEIPSDSAYSSVYIPPSGNISTTPEALQRPPLKIQLDENGAEVVTETTIAIEWDKTWFEVSDEEEPSTWHSVVGVDSNGNLLFGEREVSSITDINKILYLNNYHNEDQLSSIREKLKSMGVSNWDTIPIRYVDYSDSGSQIHVVKYDEVSDYESYLASLDLETAFTDISPTSTDTTFNYVVNSTSSGGALEPDTSYLIIVRSYFTYNGVRYYTYTPQYVIGTTTSTITETPVTPTSPILEEVSSTDTSVTVRYRTTDLYTNELRISNLLKDYSAGGISIKDATLRASGKVEAIANSNEYYIYYTVEGLFPKTTYYLWVNNRSGSLASAWSSAVAITTKDITAPATPTSLSLMSDESLENINVANSLDYEAVGKNHLIFEWARIYPDQSTKNDWIVPYSTNEVLQDLNAQRFVGSKFNNLQAFKDYYVRVRTVLTVERSGMGSNVYYSYEIELSPYADFLDKVTIIAYDSGLTPDNFDILRAYSPWSKVYTYTTGEDRDEYDGFNDPDKYPLPDSNFDITFDSSTGTLEYVFRSGGVDSTGANNNLVDQRFISELASNGNYDFLIDLTNYNYEDIKNRKVTLPYSILNTFDTFETTLTVKNDNLLVTYDFADFNDFLVSQNVKDYGINTSVSLIANEVPDLSKSLTNGQSVESVAQDLSLIVSTPLLEKELQKMPNDLDMSLFLTDKATTVDKNVNVYTVTSTDSLAYVPSTLDQDNGALEFSSKNLDTYVAVGSTSAITTGTENQKDYYYNVAKELLITDIDSFDGNKGVNSTQMNNIILAIIKGENEVAINDTLSDDDYTSLGRSGLLVSGTTVNRENGIVAMLKLYEKATGKRATLTSTLTDVPNISTVSEGNKNSIAKAYDLVLFDDSKGYNYSDSLTFDELFYMLDLIITDKE